MLVEQIEEVTFVVRRARNVTIKLREKAFQMKGNRMRLPLVIE